MIFSAAAISAMVAYGAVLQHFAPPERPGDRLDHGAVDWRQTGAARDVRAVGREHQLPPTAPADRNRHAHGDGSAVVGEIRLGHHAALRASGLIGAEIGDQLGQPLGPQPDVGAVRADIDPLDQQLDDPRLLGREQLVPERVEPLQRLAHLGLGEIRPSISALRAMCATMISGERSRPRTWSITALSISAAGTRRTGQASASRFSTSVET